MQLSLEWPKCTRSPDLKAFCRTREGAPSVVADPLRQVEIDLGSRFAADARARERCGNDARVVEDQRVARAQQTRQIANALVRKIGVVSRAAAVHRTHHQHARRVARLGRPQAQLRYRAARNRKGRCASRCFWLHARSALGRKRDLIASTATQSQLAIIKRAANRRQHLERGVFRQRVKRDLAGEKRTLPQPASAPAVASHKHVRAHRNATATMPTSGSGVQRQHRCRRRECRAIDLVGGHRGERDARSARETGPRQNEKRRALRARLRRFCRARTSRGVRCDADLDHLVGLAGGSPLLILSTFSMPSMTLPQTVYCLSRNRASSKQMKNWLLAEFGFCERAIEQTPRTCGSALNSAGRFGMLRAAGAACPAGSPSAP